MMSASAELMLIVAAIAALSVAEVCVPFRRARMSPRRIGVNLSLTALTFALNAGMSAGIIVVLASAEAGRIVLLAALDPDSTWAAAAKFLFVVAALDFAFYGSHVAMHKAPILWRFHRLHHADKMIDATTAFRQHPVEGGFRYGVIGAAALALGASPEAFAAYRFASALSAVLEHANIAVPMPLARTLALATSWPLMHKIHHSSASIETSSNYGNLLSIWDRIFSTYTQLDRAGVEPYGLGNAGPSAAVNRRSPA
jgi:sterol desaturase/sphingolipid hydroxylase (fatty acid hydroxylase superfamily)